MYEDMVKQVIDNANTFIIKTDEINKRIVIAFCVCVSVLSISFCSCISVIVISYFYSDYQYPVVSQESTTEEQIIKQQIK